MPNQSDIEIRKELVKIRREVFLSSKDTDNKENLLPMVETNSSKVNVKDGPVIRKKKRKSGKCNLRESLAWNSAFFTDEGVLDSDDLLTCGSPKSNGDNILDTANDTSVGVGSTFASAKADNARSLKKLAPQFGGCPKPALSSQKRLTEMSKPSAPSNVSNLKVKVENIPLHDGSQANQNKVNESTTHYTGLGKSFIRQNLHRSGSLSFKKPEWKSKRIRREGPPSKPASKDIHSAAIGVTSHAASTSDFLPCFLLRTEAPKSVGSTEKAGSLQSASLQRLGMSKCSNNTCCEELSLEAVDSKRDHTAGILNLLDLKMPCDYRSCENCRAVTEDNSPHCADMLPDATPPLDKQSGSRRLTAETETISYEDRSYEGGSLHFHLDRADCPSQVVDSAISTGKKQVACSKQDLFHMKLNAVPFSDEWLSALEAAGEDILAMKSGAVQNSPPDKSSPQPGPWSPVKRNAHIGPFDCTKYTITNMQSSDTWQPKPC